MSVESISDPAPDDGAGRFSGLSHNQPIAVEWVRTNDLKVPDSLKSYSRNDLRSAKRIVRRFRVQQNLVIAADNRVIIGEPLFLAAQQLGIEMLPVRRIEDLTRLECKLLSVAYARLGEIGKWEEAKLGELLLECEAELSIDIDDMGFEVAQVDLFIAAAEGAVAQEEDVIAAPEKHAVTILGDVWQLDRNRVACGDARDPKVYEDLFGGEKAHAVFTDPPFGCAIDGFVAGKGRHSEFVMGSGDMDAAELLRFFTGFNKTMASWLAPGAVIYEVIDWRSLHLLLDATRDIFGSLVNLAVWIKDRPGQGSFLRSQHELVLIFKTKGRMRNNIMLGAHGRSRSNVWSYPSALTASKGSDEGNILSQHPTPKCLRMIADALLDTTRRGDIVLDPFLGSGTSLVAAEKVGRVCYAMDLDPIFVDLAIRRWQAWTGGTAVHAVTGERFDDRAAAVAAAAVAAE